MALLFFVLAGISLPTLAQAQPTDSITPDENHTVVAVPRLTGSWFVQADVGRRFDLGTAEMPTVPVTFGAGFGYRHFLSDHGRLQLRLGPEFEIGRDQFEKADHLYVGGHIAFGLRLYSDLFAFVGSTIGITGGYLSYRLDEAGDFLQPVRNDGFEIGLKYDLSFGSLAWSTPYLFVEAELSIATKYANFGPYSGFFLGGKWTFRFDWAIKDSKYHTEPDPSPWQ